MTEQEEQALMGMARRFQAAAEQLEYDMARAPATRIAQTINRLLSEAPVLDGKGDQTPAITCHVKLRGETGTILGALSWTPEGTIRMLSGATVDGKESLLESFFDVRDVVSVMIVRPVSAAPSLIIRS